MEITDIVESGKMAKTDKVGFNFDNSKTTLYSS